MTLQQAGSTDFVFYYDSAALRDQAEADLLLLLAQNPATLFYNRGYGCGVGIRENVPNSATQQAILRTDILNALAGRNRVVTNGEDGYADRRLFASQGTIQIEQDPQTGEVDVVVSYILSGDLSALRSTRAPVGR